MTAYPTLQARNEDYPNHLLLLHVRPRVLSAGLEVAVHSGLAHDEEGELASLRRHGAVYALPRTPAELESFAADLLAASPEEWDEGGQCKLTLPTRAFLSDCGWDSVTLELLPPSAVRAAQPNAQLFDPLSSAPSVPTMLPSLYDSGAEAIATVSNKGRHLRLQPAPDQEPAGGAAAQGQGGSCSQRGRGCRRRQRRRSRRGRHLRRRRCCCPGRAAGQRHCVSAQVEGEARSGHGRLAGRPGGHAAPGDALPWPV